MTSPEVILWLQQHADWLTPVMAVFTFLGDEEFYVLVFPLLYWAVSPRVGVRVGVVLLVSAGLNGVLKLTGTTPRPYWVAPEVTAHAAESSYGVPSGHAQNAAAVWGRLAAAVRSPTVWAVAAVVILLIGVSRWQVGVHFPIDTLAGFAVGIALLAAFLLLEPRVTPRLAALPGWGQILLGLAASLGLIGLSFLAQATPWAGEPPQGWIDQAAAATGDPDPIDPTSRAGLMVPTGALFGLVVGLVLLRRLGGFDVAGSVVARVSRYLLGIVGVAALYFGLGAALPSGEDPLTLAARWGQFALVGVWIGGIAPWIFVRLRLASPSGDHPSGASPPGASPPGASSSGTSPDVR